MKLTDVLKGRILKCYNCKKEFIDKDVLLVDSPLNISIGPSFIPLIFVDKDGKIVYGNEGPDSSKGDKVLACPLCKTVHIFGFVGRDNESV